MGVGNGEAVGREAAYGIVGGDSAAGCTFRMCSGDVCGIGGGGDETGGRVQSDEQLFVALARAAMRPVAEVEAQDLANTAWAYARVKQSDEKLFVALARAAMRPGG